MTPAAEITFRSNMSVQLIQHMGGDDMIAHAARISTGTMKTSPPQPGLAEEYSGLINFLMKNRHGTPFEHNAMTFRIEAPIFVFREFHRHRIGWSYNEESSRYSKLNPVFYVPAADRNLVQIGKAGQYSFVPGTPEQHFDVLGFTKDANEEAYRAYEIMLDNGVAREVARIPLPVNIYSSMYATCNARSLMAFLSLRTKSPTATFRSFPQREIEMVADQMETLFVQLFPLTHIAFCAHGRVGP
jgi:thymidylate synthase (FAD)